MAFLVKALFRWNKCSKNADISILGNFLATFFDFFSRYREILPSTIYMPNFRSIGPSKQKLQRGAISICKKPGLFRVKFCKKIPNLHTLRHLKVYSNTLICQVALTKYKCKTSNELYQKCSFLFWQDK